METTPVNLPDPEEWRLSVFLFARWKQEPPPPPDTIACSEDLNYYLRVMRGPHWRLTVGYIGIYRGPRMN